MIDPIIFSKDRPAQLDLLLQSLKVNGAEIFHEPVIIYRTTKPEFDEGYRQCFQLHPDVIERCESEFRWETMEFVRQSLPLFCFMVDDQIMYRKPQFTYQNINKEMNKHPKATCLSLRLGVNTDWQYQTHRHINKPQFQAIDSFLLWNRNTCLPHTNYNYPLSVDAHIFRRDEILAILEQISFTQPNQLEAQLQAFLPHVGPLIMCPKTSVFVNAAINRVQNIFQNKVGNKTEYKAITLNTRFLNGDRLSLDRTVKDLEVNSCHQEIDLQWENYDV